MASNRPALCFKRVDMIAILIYADVMLQYVPYCANTLPFKNNCLDWPTNLATHRIVSSKTIYVVIHLFSHITKINSCFIAGVFYFFSSFFLHMFNYSSGIGLLFALVLFLAISSCLFAIVASVAALQSILYTLLIL